MIANQLKNIVSEFIENSHEFVRYLALNTQTMNSFSALLPDDFIVVDMANPRISLSPVAPFLAVLRNQNLSRKDVEPFTYSLQTESFVSYLETGRTDFRKDVFVFEELFYENKRCLKTIFDLITHHVNKPIVVLNAQKLKDEAISLLKLFDTPETSASVVPNSTKILLCFDFTNYNLDYDLTSFFTEVTEKANYYDASSFNLNDETCDTNATQTEETTLGFDELYSFFRDCVNFLSFSSGIPVAEHIINSSTNHMFSVPQTKKLYLQISLLYLYSNRLDDAANVLNPILDDEEDDIEDEAFFYMAQLLYAKNAFQDALKYVIMVRSKGCDKNSVWYVLSTMLYYMIIQKTDFQDAEEAYFTVLDLLREDYANNYVYTSFIFPKSIKDNRVRLQQQLATVEKSHEIAKQLDNEFALSVACHWKGIILAVAGKTEEAFKNYHKADDIRCSIGEIPPVIKIKNGISYEYLLRADYKNAFDVVNSILDRITEVKDYSEVLCTLKNVSIALFFMNHFKEAQEVYSHLVRIYKLFDLKDFIFCPMNDILMQRTIVDALSGKTTQSKLEFHNLVESPLLMSENFRTFFPFLQAIFALEEHNLDDAKACIAQAVEKVLEEVPSYVHQIPFMYFQFANALHKKGYTEEGKAFQKLGMEFAKKHSLRFYLEHIANISVQDYNTQLLVCDKLNTNLEHIEEIASKEQLLNTLHKRVRDSLFLNKLTDLASASKSREEYVRDVAQSIFEYMLCDSIYIAEKIDNEWNLMASVSKGTEDVPGDNEWENYIDLIPNYSEKFIKRGEHSLFFNLSKFASVCGVIINLNPAKTYSMEDINILNVGLSSLSSQLTIINQNEHLLMISSMDQLSSLKNRRALQEKLSTESEMIRRYQGKSSAYFQTSVTFIDLDHFKFYNDTFGHEAGDILIAEFSSLLRKIYRRVDFISRFGGDEFVVLLPNTTDEEALRAADRLREGLEQEKHFLPVLERRLGMKLDVPECHYLNFSAGICSNVVLDDKSDMNMAMQKADKALFAAKNSGRSRTVLWTELS